MRAIWQLPNCVGACAPGDGANRTGNGRDWASPHLEPELRDKDVDVHNVPMRDDPRRDVVHGQLQHDVHRADDALHLTHDSWERRNTEKQSDKEVRGVNKHGSTPLSLLCSTLDS